GRGPYFMEEWVLPSWFTAIGGIILTVSGFMFFFNMLGSLWLAPKGQKVEVPVAEPLIDEGARMPLWLDRFTVWAGAAVLLVAIAYTPTLVRLISDASFTVPGLSPF
ncbi:MAG: hypothetical protein FWJ83_10460, partial [Limnochordales bacterium]